MGRIIKGSPASGDRYTVGVPAASVMSPADARDENGFFDSGDEFATFVSDERAGSTPAPSPEIELAAIQAQAQELIDDAARSAEQLVDDARTRARTIVDDAGLEARAVVADARRAAHDDGYAAGILAANAEMADMLAAMRGLLESTRTERHAVIHAAEPELVRLALGIAERVLHQQVALDNSVVVEMAKAAIARLVDREKVTVRVNPADIERMREHRDDLLSLGDVKTMRLIEDQRVDRGGVIVETDSGNIDAKISTQLTEVRKILHIVDDVVVQPAPAALLDDASPSARAS